MHYLTFQQSLETGTVLSFRNCGLARNTLFKVTWVVSGGMRLELRPSSRCSLPHSDFSTLGIFCFWSLRLALVASALTRFGLKTQRADIRFDCHIELRSLPQELFAVDPTTGSQGLKDEVLYKCRKCR